MADAFLRLVGRQHLRLAPEARLELRIRYARVSGAHHERHPIAHGKRKRLGYGARARSRPAGGKLHRSARGLEFQDCLLSRPYPARYLFALSNDMTPLLSILPFENDRGLMRQRPSAEWISGPKKPLPCRPDLAVPIMLRPEKCRYTQFFVLKIVIIDATGSCITD